MRQLLYTRNMREAIEAVVSGQPPLTGVVLKDDLIPTPAETLDLARQLKPDGVESLAIKMIDEGLPFVARHAEFSVLVFKDRHHRGIA